MAASATPDRAHATSTGRNSPKACDLEFVRYTEQQYANYLQGCTRIRCTASLERDALMIRRSSREQPVSSPRPPCMTVLDLWSVGAPTRTMAEPCLSWTRSNASRGRGTRSLSGDPRKTLAQPFQLSGKLVPMRRICPWVSNSGRKVKGSGTPPMRNGAVRVSCPRS